MRTDRLSGLTEFDFASDPFVKSRKGIVIGFDLDRDLLVLRRDLGRSGLLHPARQLLQRDLRFPLERPIDFDGCYDGAALAALHAGALQIEREVWLDDLQLRKFTRNPHASQTAVGIASGCCAVDRDPITPRRGLVVRLNFDDSFTLLERNRYRRFVGDAGRQPIGLYLDRAVEVFVSIDPDLQL